MIQKDLSILSTARCKTDTSSWYSIENWHCRFPLEVHIVHKKVGEPEFLSVPGGLAVTGFFFEVSNLVNLVNKAICYYIFQIAAEDNAALTPLVEKLGEIKEADKKYNMSGSPFLVRDFS